MRRTKQLELGLKAWGGRRAGAGRPRRSRELPHVARPALSRRTPLHVTLRIAAGLPNLRVKSVFRAVRGALVAGAERFGFRLVHYSVQRDHLHLIVEAEGNKALRRGMVGLQVRLARRINAIAGRVGRVFVDRYHLQVLVSPRQVRHALAYVLGNGRKHAKQRGLRLPARWQDPCSTEARFAATGRGLGAARTWLLRFGWRRGVGLAPASPGACRGWQE